MKIMARKFTIAPFPDSGHFCHLYMNKLTAYLLIGFAILLYLLSALTFFDYMYSLVIPDTVTAVENAFGKLVLLIFMLVMAKFSMSAGQNKLKNSDSAIDDESSEVVAEISDNGSLDADQTAGTKGSEK